MITSRRSKTWATLPAWVAWLATTPGLAQQPAPAAGAPQAQRADSPIILDVALQESGQLIGRIVDRQGIPQPSAPVIVRQDNRVVARVTPDSGGRFVVSGLRGGIYLVDCGGMPAICRCWAPQTAPPVARPELLVVADDVVARGQIELGRALLSGPVLFGVITAAAIAIPLSLNKSSTETDAPGS